MHGSNWKNHGSLTSSNIESHVAAAMEPIDPPDKNELLRKIKEYEQFTELKLKPKIRELEKVKVKVDQIDCLVDSRTTYFVAMINSNR